MVSYFTRVHTRSTHSRIGLTVGATLLSTAGLLAFPCVALAQDAGTTDAATAAIPDDDWTADPPATDAGAADAATSDAGPSAEPPAQSGACEGPRVSRVRWRGLQRVSAPDVSTALRVREGVCFERRRLQQDARLLWNSGFFHDVQVTADPAPDGGIDVQFVVVERPSLRQVRFVGHDGVEEEKLRESIDLREGAVLNESAVRRNVQRIRDMYSEKGYFLAEVRYEIVRRTDAENESDVVFTIRENAQVQVRAVHFVGNQSITDDELRASIQTQAAGFFSFLTSTGSYREEAFRNDIDLLHAAYYDRGFLNVEIGTPRVALSADRRWLDITVPVREGPRYRVGRLQVTESDVENNEIEPLGGRRRVREMFHFNPGDWFSRTTIGRDILSLQTYYRDQGYANVEVRPDVQPRASGQTVDLNFNIRRGALTTIHRIVIRGNTKTADRVIRRELAIIEGERYSETRYQESRRRAMALGYFERVELSTETVEGHPDWVIVNVEVTEKPTGTFQVGAGVSSVETFILTAQIQQQNLFGRGQGFTLQAQLSPLRQIFAFRFVEPYLFDSNWTGAVDLYNTLRAFANFSRTATGGSLSTGYPLLGTNDLRLSLSYTGEFVGVNRGGASTLLNGQTLPQNISTNPPIEGVFRSGFNSAIGISITGDNRDNRIQATSGIFARLGFEVSDRLIGAFSTDRGADGNTTPFEYMRLSGAVQAYAPLFWGIVLKTRINGGLVTSRNESGVPLAERYFLGGIMDVRGYRLRTLGPVYQVPGMFNDQPTLLNFNIGGNVQFFYNVELEFPIPFIERVGLRGVLFHDAGNTWNLESKWCEGRQTAESARHPTLSPCGFNPLLLRSSVGFGLRWFSPLGLLRFEWGFPLNRIDGLEDPSVFEFTIGNSF
ncbi:MAG: outer membrane protein assembly factor BamA [Deltaproteobacteria bacterium]|nr:outer membrane protein assembly factor BamA [Deltaproteobacteria bacterium]